MIVLGYLRPHAFGLLNYTSQREGAAIVETNLAGRDVRQKALEMEAIRQGNYKLKNAFLHLVLAHDPDEHDLSASELRYAVGRIRDIFELHRTGFEANCHTDKPHQHVHAVSCLINVDGSTISTSHLYRRCFIAAQLITAELRQMRGLESLELERMSELGQPADTEPHGQYINEIDEEPDTDFGWEGSDEPAWSELSERNSSQFDTESFPEDDEAPQVGWDEEVDGYDDLGAPTEGSE